MLKTINIKNYKIFKDSAIENIERFNLIIGDNHSGKTSLLEAIFMTLGGHFPPVLLNTQMFRKNAPRNSFWWNTFFNNFLITNPIEISLIDDSSETQLREILIKPLTALKDSKTHYATQPEAIKISSTSLPEKPYENTNGILEQVIFGNPDKKAPYLENTYKLTGFIQTNNIRGQQEVGGQFELDQKHLKSPLPQYIPAHFIYPKLFFEFADIVQSFSEVQTLKKVQKLVTLLQKVEPSLTNVALGQDSQILVDIGKSQLVSINLLGEGFIRMLGIASRALSISNSILLIDEIENGLSYTSLKELLSFLNTLSIELNIQIFVTTHSIRCIQIFSELSNQNSGLALIELQNINETIEANTLTQNFIPQYFSKVWNTIQLQNNPEKVLVSN